MWRIDEHRKVDKQLAGMPQEILKRYEKWKDIAMISGPSGLKSIKGLHDESLAGQWKGHRSSRLGLQTGSSTEQCLRTNYSKWFRLQHTIIGGDRI